MKDKNLGISRNEPNAFNAFNSFNPTHFTNFSYIWLLNRSRFCLYFIFSAIIPYFYILPFCDHKTSTIATNFCLSDILTWGWFYMGKSGMKEKLIFTRILYTFCPVSYFLGQCRKYSFQQTFNMSHLAMVEKQCILMPIDY